MLDRDGTINAERHYLASPDEVELLPGAVEGEHVDAVHALREVLQGQRVPAAQQVPRVAAPLEGRRAEEADLGAVVGAGARAGQLGVPRARLRAAGAGDQAGADRRPRRGRSAYGLILSGAHHREERRRQEDHRTGAAQGGP